MHVSVPSTPLHTATAAPTPASQTDSVSWQWVQDVLPPTPQSRILNVLRDGSSPHARDGTQPRHPPAIQRGTCQTRDGVSAPSRLPRPQEAYTASLKRS